VSLTGAPLLALTIIGAVAAAVGMVFVWRRPGLRWVPARALSIVLCEALVLMSVGLVANTQLDLYPSWTALLGGIHEKGQVVDDPSSALGKWLQGRQAEGAKDGIVFNWHPAGAAQWHLASQPIAYVPPAYFRDPNALLPVIVAIAPPGATAAQAAWDDKGVAKLVQAPPPDQRKAIILLIRLGQGAPKAHPSATASHPTLVPHTGASGTAAPHRPAKHPSPTAAPHLPSTAEADTLSVALPTELQHDLRVTRHGWALIGVGSAASSALDVFAGDPGPFTALAVVAGGTGALPTAVVKQVRALPVGTASMVIVDSGKQPPAQAAGVAAIAKPQARLGAALDWAYPVLPPTLGPPAVLGPVIIPKPSPTAAGPPLSGERPVKPAHPTGHPVPQGSASTVAKAA
jgi:hypothetical protein